MPAKAIASQVLSQLGYQSVLGFVNNPRAVSKEQVVGLMVGRVSGRPSFVGIDFLLPVFPSVHDAVKRAQESPIDYGFARIPTIQPEDLIIAKLFALRDAPDRGVDLLDIHSIMEGIKPLDHPYLERKLTENDLSLPVKL